MIRVSLLTLLLIALGALLGVVVFGALRALVLHLGAPSEPRARTHGPRRYQAMAEKHLKKRTGREL